MLIVGLTVSLFVDFSCLINDEIVSIMFANHYKRQETIKKKVNMNMNFVKMKN